MNVTEPVPASLRDVIAADLHRVRPLPPPGTRALWMLPLAAILLLAAPATFGPRGDVRALGWALSWGASTFQALIGILLVGWALRESIPGRSLPSAAIGAALSGALAFALLITFFTVERQRTGINPDGVLVVGAICLGFTIVSALPAVLLAALLAARALPLRPKISGALYGLGAGLMADAGWRLFCHFSVPTHVVPAHLGGVVVSTALGIFVAERLRRSLARDS